MWWGGTGWGGVGWWLWGGALCDAWWRHQMETFFGPGEFPTQRPVTRSFDVFFDQRLNKRLSKQSWGWWFETLSRPLWYHCNGRTFVLFLCQHLFLTFSLCRKDNFLLVTFSCDQGDCENSRTTIRQEAIPGMPLSVFSKKQLWHHMTMLTLVQMMTCCPMAPSYSLYQCWLAMKETKWH